MKLKKKLIITAAVVAVAGTAAFFGIRAMNGNGPQLQSVSVTPLAKMDLTNTVSVTGTVKSKDEVNVYSTLNYQVKTVNVEVGDTVTEGQVLCELDTADLLVRIEQDTITLNNNQAKNQLSLSMAQKNYESAKRKQGSEYDTTLLAKQNAIHTAERSLETLQVSLSEANADLRRNRNGLKDYQDNVLGGATDDYDATQESYRKSITEGQNRIDKLKKDIEDAKQAIADRKFELNAFLQDQKEALESAQDSLKQSTLNANMDVQRMALEELKKDLDEAVIKAPVSGTVTAVMAKEGGSGAGLLFVIEDTDSLKVNTKIQEYDIAAVEVGQPTIIKSDGTGDDEYNGQVIKIAPTAVKAANGETVETTDVQFVTEIGVTSKGTKLKIGMNARLDIVTEEKKDVFAVPYDAVVENANGEQVVYVAVPKAIPTGGPDVETADGAQPAALTVAPAGGGERPSGVKIGGGNGKGQAPSFTVMEIPVTSGMETDFYMEITSNALTEGALIISNPVGLANGDEVAVSGGAGSAGAAAGGQRAGGGPRGGMGVRIG